MRAFARILSATVFGPAAHLVDVQVSVTVDEDGDDTAFRIVGLPDSALREGRDRIRSAIHHGGWPWRARGVLVNLAPAGLRKEGAALDLPMAVGILGAIGFLGTGVRVTDAKANGDVEPRAGGQLASWLCLGELTLDGGVRGIRGVLAAVEAARQAGIRHAIVPRANAREAAAVEGMTVIAVRTLAEATLHLSAKRPLAPVPATAWHPAAWGGDRPPPVRGQRAALEAGWIAAAGGHNLLLSGPPGSGKTLLARHLADVLPPFTYTEALEASRIWSVAGLLDQGLLERRPFRAPHHSTSLAGLVGGGSVPRPGEVSLAHRGVLFLDELAEFRRGTLEALRQPVEDGALVIGRAAGRARFPSRVVLVAATNPCPCGWRGVGNRCRCSERDVTRYRSRISGPLRDRFDLEVEVRPVDPRHLVSEAAEAPFSPDVMAGAWARQAERASQLGLSDPWNARLPGRLLPDAAGLNEEAREHLVARARAVGLSGRGVHRCVRVARTIADLADHEEVELDDVAQAMAFRTDC